MNERYDADAIVVGSGFGGAVAAARLAQAGFTVILLERGRRWRPGGFPRRPDLNDGWMWELDRGLYDIRWLGTMASVQAAGWGGGSLAYANVFARPFEGALDDRWPADLRRERLDPYYDLAAHMLEVAPVEPDPRTGRPPARTTLIEGVTRGMEMSEATVRPNLAVTFGDPDSWRPNRHGVPQRGCAFVGECVIGCNHGAKNTLDHNYLAVAERFGARAVTDAEVRRIEPREGGYAVSASTPSDPEAPLREWTAARVVLAAGAVATNELLLRSRDVHGTLPGLSRHLGRGFSGNGDFLTLAELRGEQEDMTTGPTITTNTVLDVPEGRRSVWYQVQDGAIPPPVQELLDAVLPGRRMREWRRRRNRVRTVRHGFAVLGMGRDSGDGTLRLNEDDELRLSWRNSWQAELYRSQLRLGPMLGRILDARLYQPVTWSLMRRTVTVHPLGGVRPGADADTGVVDSAGEVHGHPGLFVMDGSVLPAATGVNPSATILAVAERSIETVIRRSGLEGWRAPEWDSVTSTEIPEDAAFAYMSERHTSTKGNGLVFSERMATRRRRPKAVVHLTAEIPGMDRFLADPTHTVPMRGVIEVEGVASQAAIEGTLSLFAEGRREAMSYAMSFEGDDGRPWRLSGTKTVRSRTPWGLLSGLTRLQTEVAPVDAEPGEAVRFELVIAAGDLIRLGTSIRGRGFTRARRLRAVARFASFFTGSSLRRRTSRVPRDGAGEAHPTPEPAAE